MKKWEAESKRIFTGPNGVLITAKVKISRTVDTSWIYSMHWKDDTWVEDAKRDCLHRIDCVKSDLHSLETAMKILESIEE